MPQDVDLEEVYTAVKFLDKSTAQQRFGSLTNLEDNYRELGKRRFQSGECQPVKGFKVANEHQFLYVLGNPGAGKSTFLRRVGLEALKGKEGEYKHELIPVMIELKKFNRGQVDLIAAITEELSYFNFPEKTSFTKEFLQQGKLLLLFDGLDEVANIKVDDVQDVIANLVTRYGQKGNRFILSCRTAANKNLSSMINFTNVELADFDDEQIEKFINNWFKSDPEDAKHCWEKLSKPEYEASKELAQTPLLLTFLCLVYGDYGDFPAIKSQLYAQALDILLYKWDREKKLKRDKIYEKWNINFELTLLTNFAYDFFEQDKLFFQKEQILDYLEVFLDDTEGDSRNVDVHAVLDAIAIQQGIFVERTTNIYSFFHLTLQEYLTAKYISQKDSRIQKLVTESLTDRRWKEVFLLVAGIKDEVDPLLELMAEATHNLMNTPKLKNILQWVERITDSTDSDFKYPGKRALAIANAYANTTAYANAYFYANTITSTNTNANVCAKESICYFLLYISWSQQWKIYRDIDYSSLTNQLEILKQKIPNYLTSKYERNFFIDKLLKT